MDLFFKEIRNRVGRSIRKIRLENGMSSQYISKKTNISQSTICRIESGKTSISSENLCLIANIFNKPLSYFVWSENEGYEEIELQGLLKGLIEVIEEVSKDISDKKTFKHEALKQLKDLKNSFKSVQSVESVNPEMAIEYINF